MIDQDGEIIEELKKLIGESCKFDEQPREEYQKFHKSLLKFYFGALDVKLNYETKSIAIWSSKPSTENLIKLYNFKDALSEMVNYTDLEETLFGCVEKGTFNERFYKHLLHDFGCFESNDGMKIA